MGLTPSTTAIIGIAIKGGERMTSDLRFDAAAALPADWREGLFLGRIDRGAGPTPVLVAGGIVHDMAMVAPTTADLVARDLLDPALGEPIGDLDALGLGVGPDAAERLLSPVDLQCVKAAGVTFAVSALERVIEERARGDAAAAAEVRARLEERIGGNLRAVEPGSEGAASLKAALIEDGMWSQYLEVAIGPDAEIFSKCPPMASVGWGAPVGIRSDSTTTSTCAISRAARRCYCPRRRTTTPPPRSAPLSGCLTTASPSTMSGRPR
jgi:fumarylacetoacetate (FAA) hydrolase family protein